MYIAWASFCNVFSGCGNYAAIFLTVNDKNDNYSDIKCLRFRT